MASNPWDNDPIVQPSPQYPGVIQGAPKTPAPRTAEQETLDRLKIEKDMLDIRAGQRKEQAGAEAEAIEGERKAAAFLIRALGAEDNYTKTGVGAPSLIGQTARDIAPNIANYFTGEDRQTANSTQDEFIAATLRQDSGAAIPEEELERQRRIYFPMPGDGQDVIEQKRQARLRALAGLRQSAGRLEESAEARYNALVQTELQQTMAAQGGEGPTDQGAIGYTPEGLQVTVTDDSPDPTVAAASQKITDQFGAPGAGDLAKQGFTLGLSDEAAGIGGAIAGALQGNFDVSGNYYLNRDVERLRLEEARNRLGGTGTAIEALGGVATGGIGAAGGASVNALAKAGGMAGAVGGFGYGEGFQGSSANALLGAAGGAALGGGLGYIGQRAGQASVARQAERAAMGQRAQDVSQAGAAEGVTVNRAMVDPRLQNRVTGVDATMAGGPTIQRQMGAIEGQIGSRVDDLGRGGTPLNPEEAGGTIKEAAERFITKSGESARIKYDRAEQLAGNVKIEPKQSLQAVDQMIAQLGETPNTNKAELAFLQEIKSDLGQNLSVGALRRMRTSLRQKISKGELTFGESEARVLAIMDSAADDIRAGLTQAGNTGAARAFDAADTAYRARMDYINGTIQKVIGKRNANKPAEQVFTTFSNMAKGKDAAGLRKFYATLEPDEAADVAATFASELGRNNKGEFTVAHFLSQSEKFSDSALTTIFGRDGAESVKNLRTIGSEVARVTGSMNSRKSGTAVGNDYRSWVFNLMLGAGSGAYSGNVATGVAAAAAGAGIKASRDILSARALMSPKITKWLKMAPRTTNPKAIDAHFERLGDIARAEPALAQDIEVIRQAFMQAANDNAALSTSVAQDQDPQER